MPGISGSGGSVRPCWIGPSRPFIKHRRCHAANSMKERPIRPLPNREAENRDRRVMSATRYPPRMALASESLVIPPGAEAGRLVAEAGHSLPSAKLRLPTAGNSSALFFLHVTASVTRDAEWAFPPQARPSGTRDAALLSEVWRRFFVRRHSPPRRVFARRGRKGGCDAEEEKGHRCYIGRARCIIHRRRCITHLRRECTARRRRGCTSSRRPCTTARTATTSCGKRPDPTTCALARLSRRASLLCGGDRVCNGTLRDDDARRAKLAAPAREPSHRVALWLPGQRISPLARSDGAATGCC